MNKINIRFIFILTIIFIKTVNSQLFSSVFQFLREGTRRLNLEVPDTKHVESEYDFIIVGAGTAGCALANRLTENPDWEVLLIEAGTRENLVMDIPAAVHYLQQTNINWRHKTKSSNSSCLGMVNNQCNWPRGKVMGGSSVLNYMIYTRGSRHDYDRWASLGNEGWSYKDVEPYFKKLEKSMIHDADSGYPGKDGPLTISYVNYKTSIARAFVNAGLQSGSKKVDYNGASMIGFSYLQTTINRGARESSNSAYLYPIHDRPNLHVKKMSHVTNIIVDRNTKEAVGVRFYNRRKYYSVRARKEVILSAGTINSPQILMLSGIGPEDHLREMGIKPIVNLPVGYNLMDHAATGALTFITNTSAIRTAQTVTLPNIIHYTEKGTGPISIPGACEAVAFYDTDHPNDPDGYPDLELLQIGGSMAANDILPVNFGIKQEIYDRLFKNLENNEVNSFMVFPMVLRPKSRGRITLKSKNPFEHPIIDPNYYSDPYDMKISIRGIRQTIALMKTPAFKRINAKLYDVPLHTCSHHTFDSDDYWDCFTRHFTFTIYHHTSTCKMGPKNDAMAVVDPRLRVYGIKNLRVADASVMPEVIAAHTNGPTYMIAEKAADMIKEDWKNSF